MKRKVGLRQRVLFSYPTPMETATYTSPIGIITLESNGQSLTGLWLEGQLPTEPKGASIPDKTDIPVDKKPCDALLQAKNWLDVYFSGKEPSFTPPLHLEGTPFQLLIWNTLLKIPYGTTRTYGEIAKEIAAIEGKTHMSAQAVGGAVGRNPIAIIVPCHRVMGANGKLTGYQGGVHLKTALLQTEGIETSRYK